MATEPQAHNFDHLFFRNNRLVTVNWQVVRHNIQFEFEQNGTFSGPGVH